MTDKNKKILKWVVIGIAVPTVALVAYAGVSKGLDYFAKKKQEGDLKKIVDALKAGIEKRAKDKKKTVSEKEVQETESKWMEELKKLSGKALSTFGEWFVLTVPYGKDKNSAWSYEMRGAAELDEFNRKKDAVYPKYYEELATKTKVQQLFEEFEMSLDKK